MVKCQNNQSLQQLFSRSMTLSIFGWLLIASTLTVLFFQYYFELSFKTTFTSIASVLTLIHKSKLIFSLTLLIISLFLLTIYARIYFLKVHPMVKILLLICPTLFIFSILSLSTNTYLFITELNIPFKNGIFALQRYAKNFSAEQIHNAIATLPYQINSIKYPLYGLIYSYVGMFTITLLIPFKWTPQRYSIIRCINLLVSSIFIIAFLSSIYYLTLQFIVNDPFKYL